MSDRCTRPSMPPGIDENTPKSVIDLMAPWTLSAALSWRRNPPRGSGGTASYPARCGSGLRRFQDHDFDFFAQGHDLARIDVLGPVHFGDVQAPMPASTSTKRTVVGEVGDLAEQAGALRVAAAQADQGSSPSCLTPSETRDFPGRTGTLASISWPTCSTSEGWRTAPGHVGDVQRGRRCRPGPRATP